MRLLSRVIGGSNRLARSSRLIMELGAKYREGKGME